MPNESFNAGDIAAGFPERVRPFLPVLAAQLPEEYRPLIVAAQEAVGIVGRVVRLDHKTHMVFGTSPFVLNLAKGRLVYEAEPATLGSYVEDFIIFIDCARLAPYTHEFKVAGILEELAHSLMHVADEALVKQIVCLLYPTVRLVGGQYELPAST